MDLAPPPYTETDPSECFSTAGTSTTTTGTTGRPLPSTFSPNELIFTPPYSPVLSSYATDHDHLFSSSAAAYFDSRPATLRNTGPPSIYRIVVTSHTQPQDLPFPEVFRSHGVLDQDWLTFLNYLLSDFIFNASRDTTDLKDGVGQREGNNKLEMTIADWNEGFFKPRGLQITTLTGEEEVAEVAEASTPRVPGSWIPHDHIPYDHEILGGSSAGRKKGFFGGFKGFQGGPQGGFRMGPIVADNDGFRMGNVLIADQNGLRLGGKSFMRRETTESERGRPWANTRHLRKLERSSSVSTSSSSASDISTDSESSVGSLPEYDDLRDQQLSLTKQSLLNWFNHPEQTLTKVSVQQIRQEIQYAGNVSSYDTEQDLTLLRKEVRDLLREFRESKKKQKKDRRRLRRERRSLKRAHKTERRTARREARRLKRDGKSAKGKEVRRPPWMTSKSTIELEQPPPMPPRPTPDLAIPFTRAASAPSIHETESGGPSSVGGLVPGVTTAMHATWPYSRNAPHSPGNTYKSPRIPGAFPQPFPISSEQLYTQAKEMELSAQDKEEIAIELRIQATSRRIGEKDRLRKLDQATTLEEEAEKYILEADRLRTEALHLDSELARELEDSTARGYSASLTLQHQN